MIPLGRVEEVNFLDLFLARGGTTSVAEFNFEACFVKVPLLMYNVFLSPGAGCRRDVLCVDMKFTPDSDNIWAPIDISTP